MKKNYFNLEKRVFRLGLVLFLLISGFLINLKAQTHSKSILVNFGSNTCGTDVPHVSLIDKSNSSNNIILNCNISSTVTGVGNTAVEYNAQDNKIYIARLNAGSTNIFMYDVGLTTQVFACPVLPATAPINYSYGISNFSIDQRGDVYTISNYNATTAAATFTKIVLSTGAVISTQTVQFPIANKPTSFANGDLTFVANGKLYAVFQSGTAASKLYEITNYGITGTAVAVFLKDIPKIINGIAFINDQLQLSGTNSDPSCYTYLYDIASSTLGASSPNPNSFAPVDHTSIYTSIGSTKRIINNTTINTNTSDIEYELYLQNTGNVNLNGVQLKDDLGAVFGAANISNLNVSIINNPSNLTLNGAYNGTTNTNLLATGQNLTNLITANFITIKVKLRVTNINLSQIYNNQGFASGYVGTALNNVQVTDYTNDGPPSAIYPLGLDTLTPYKYLLPFACGSTMYLTQYGTGTGTSFYSLNNVTNPLTITQIGATTAATVRLNGIGFNPVDNFIYGINNVDNHLYRIDAGNYNFDLGVVANLPAGSYISGDIDTAGNYYVKANLDPQTLYKINVVTKVATAINLIGTANTLDLAFNKLDGLLYGVSASNLITINPTTGTVTIIGATGAGNDFGAMYTDGITGAVYSNKNTGTFYNFNKTTGVATAVSASIGAQGNDGAHCVNSGILFGAEVKITKTDGKTEYIPGTTNTYTVVVSNAGPFTALNANVKDALPSGVPAANITYTSAIQTGGSSVIISGGSGTGAINSFVNIQKGESITYTITLMVPITYTGNLSNTATVTLSADNVETDTTDNSATDTDTAGACYNDANSTGTPLDTKHGITLLQRAGAGDTDNWPLIRKGAFTALESNTKGFVITRVAGTSGILKPIEGMMVYDTVLGCLKIYDGTIWSCFKNPACP